VTKGAAIAAIIAVIGAIVGSHFIVPSDLQVLNLIAVVGTIFGSILGAVALKKAKKAGTQIALATLSAVGFLIIAIQYHTLSESSAAGLTVVYELAGMMFAMFGCFGFLLQTAGVQFVDQKE
jgi:drug/metabolite transporter (DMT)-like permease